jgi:hypothetical protein
MHDRMSIQFNDDDTAPRARSSLLVTTVTSVVLLVALETVHGKMNERTNERERPPESVLALSAVAVYLSKVEEWLEPPPAVRY